MYVVFFLYLAIKCKICSFESFCKTLFTVYSRRPFVTGKNFTFPRRRFLLVFNKRHQSLTRNVPYHTINWVLQGRPCQQQVLLDFAHLYFQFLTFSPDKVWRKPIKVLTQQSVFSRGLGSIPVQDLSICSVVSRPRLLQFNISRNPTIYFSKEICCCGLNFCYNIFYMGLFNFIIFL